ncbi:globin domain-containing protein [Helicobacter trogontum]|uniref:Bacitracin resistance protein BacA n=1 Tax=Helicobacter trogontum TaxID=50960 RepID=A0A4U8T714_9HELI|nr:globin domain-containing protein [Helicobacter trogontum]MDY5185195.1 globin domain-containing protein [Helicobacter trogontum]TLD95430.1 bacitracin resistance protein BacA [Helicobacter trogontum]
MLDKHSIEIVKSTVPVLKTHGETITKEFYNILFTNYPQVQGMFDMTKQKSGKQPKALAMAVLNAAMNIENLDSIRSQIESIGKTHVKLNVKKEHYPIVGECLIKALKNVLQENATDEILQAWEKAYQEIANYYIEVEEKMYNLQ